jgi:RNA recognition motif-containing protein
MDREGFVAAYDLVYLPIDFATRTGLGYAFVNFTTEDNATRFMEHFQGFSAWGTPSKKTCEVTLSNELQGFDAHVERYRSSPVMHESVPDEFKPVIFVDGVRIDFPPPTKPIKQPRLRASRQKLKTARRWGSDVDGSQPALSELATPMPKESMDIGNVPDEF